MGRNPAWLNPKQVGVLLWIKDGCPIGDREDGYERRITARALERRGFVTIKGHGASWAASITKTGLAWLAAHPTPPPIDAEVDALIARVIAADGRLVLPAGHDVEMTYEQLVKLSEHVPSRPKGWRLTMRATGPGDEPRKEIVLVRYIEDLVEEAPVPVAERVARYHPRVRAFLGDRDHQCVSKEHLARAARILHAIADEAPRRGLEVLARQVEYRVGTYHPRAASHWHLVLGSPAGPYGIRIQEVSAPGGKAIPPRRWNERRTRPAWLDARQLEFIGTGVLELLVDGPAMAYNGTRYRDATTIPLEEKLPRVFRRIEIHRLEAEAREEARQREAADRQQRWEAAVADARRRYDEQSRWDHFQALSREWHETVAQRAFLAAVRAAVDDQRGRRLEGLAAHLDFAERRIDERDPLKHLELLVPDVPEPKPDDLKPFLDGWSPHGPGSVGW